VKPRVDNADKFHCIVKTIQQETREV